MKLIKTKKWLIKLMKKKLNYEKSDINIKSIVQSIFKWNKIYKRSFT